MPENSRFFGIVISMNFEDHAPPHFHARYGEHKARIMIESADVAVTALPRRRLRLTLTDGSVVERDVSDLLWGGVFERIATSDAAFADVTVANGTASWLKDGADIAPETLIWKAPSRQRTAMPCRHRR